MTIFVAEFEKKNLTTYESENVSEQSIKQTLFFATPIVRLGTDLNKLFKDNIIDEILKSVENTAIQGSEFTLSRIIKLDVQICSYDPLKGSSFIETPKKLKQKKALVNVKNINDDMCFKWSVLSALHPAAKNPLRLQHYIPLRLLKFEQLFLYLELSHQHGYRRLFEKCHLILYFDPQC